MIRLATFMLHAFLARFPGWLLPLALTLVFTSGCSAEAGWFTRGPDPKVEAANRALERAAQIAAEAANVQAQQHGQILEAVTALSSERTHMAEQLSVLGKLAAKDSVLAAALESLGPALVAMAALVLGSAAIWLVTRSASHDTELATMLVEEACCGTGLLSAHSQRPRLESDGPMPRALEDHDDTDRGVAALAHSTNTNDPDTEEGGFPF